MSHPTPDDEAERHRQAAAATEHHAKPPITIRSTSPRVVAPTTSRLADSDSEATFFVRHRGKLAAGVMVVVIIIFFTFVFGFIRF